MKVQVVANTAQDTRTSLKLLTFVQGTTIVMEFNVVSQSGQ